MPESATNGDPFFRLRSVFRRDGRLHAGLVRPFFSRAERVRPKREFLFHLHQHQEFEFIFVIRGPYEYRHNNVSFRLPRNTVLVLEPGDWHQDHCRPPLDYAAILCTLRSRGDGSPLRDLRFFRENTPLSRRFAKFQASLFLPLLDKIAREAKIDGKLTPNLQDTLMEELFWRVAQSFEPGQLASWLAPPPSQELFLTRLSSAMARHAQHAFPVPELARSLGLSQRGLRKRCATLLGDSPARLFLRYKIGQARKLFAESDMSVKEVSDRFGFANPFHFSRVYKSITGLSPSHTRKERTKARAGGPP